MAKLKRQELKIADITDAFKEISGLIKENYRLLGLELTSSLYEENLKVLSSQLDKRFVLQGDYMNLNERPLGEISHRSDENNVGNEFKALNRLD